MGTHLTRLPKLFWHCQRLMLTQGNHEPIILPIENALIPIEEALLSAPIFLQVQTFIPYLIYSATAIAHRDLHILSFLKNCLWRDYKRDD
jgi:hypothetical protein